MMDITFKQTNKQTNKQANKQNRQKIPPHPQNNRKNHTDICVHTHTHI